MNQEIRILALIAIALILGGLVLLVNPDYRIEKNIESNRDYYPDVVIEEKYDPDVPQLIDLDDEQVVNDEAGPPQDFEF